jgi:hypothetical protein
MSDAKTAFTEEDVELLRAKALEVDMNRAMCKEDVYDDMGREYTSDLLDTMAAHARWLRGLASRIESMLPPEAP